MLCARGLLDCYKPSVVLDHPSSDVVVVIVVDSSVVVVAVVLTVVVVVIQIPIPNTSSFTCCIARDLPWARR